MAGMLYYLPGDAEPTAKRLGALDFPHADAVGSSERIATGPDGGSGWLFALGCVHPAGRVPKLVCDAADPWRLYLGGDLWCATSIVDPPRPVDFLRVETPVGHLTKLADGQDWIVCPVRTRLGEFVLPTQTVSNQPKGLADWADVDGTHDVVVDRYADLADAAVRLADHPEELTADDVLTLFGYAIGRNYRLTLWECGPLGLLDGEALARIMCALTDNPAMEVTSG